MKMSNNNMLDFPMPSKLIIGKSLKDAIYSYKGSDGVLADKIGISRDTLWKWKTGYTTNIRKSNLIPLAEELNLEIVITDSVVELQPILQKDIPINTIEEKNVQNQPLRLDEQINNLTLLKQQMDTIEDLRQDKKDLKIVNNKLRDEIKQLNDIISKFTANRIDTNLDHSRMQFIVNMKEQTFLSVTQLYADLYSTDAFNMIKNYKWADVVHECDQWRFTITEFFTEDEMLLKQVWKVKVGNKFKFVESRVLPLDSDGVFRKVDAELSSEEGWEKSNDFYKKVAERHQLKMIKN